MLGDVVKGAPAGEVMKVRVSGTIVRSTMIALVILCGQREAAAQDERFEVGAQAATAVSGEFDATDVGIGARFAWRPTGVFGLEGEFDVYPQEFPDTGVAISGGRVEALVGVTVGPQLGRIRPFVRIRPGVLRFQEAPAPVPCILIFPPPLGCSLAAGETMFALDVGGGVEVQMTPRTLLRVDVGDRLVRYPGPAFDSNREVHDDDFFGHDVRVAVGAGVRF